MGTSTVSLTATYVGQALTLYWKEEGFIAHVKERDNECPSLAGDTEVPGSWGGPLGIVHTLVSL